MLEIVAKKLLAFAGVSVNGVQPHSMRVNDNHVLADMMRRGSLGLAEAYMDQHWDCDELDEFFFRVLGHRLDLIGRLNPFALRHYFHDWLRPAITREQAFEIGTAHYDLGNDFFERMLDPTMTYTCAYWKNPALSLEEAQREKLDLICRKLRFIGGERVLDIGCGWGSFAKFAAEKYNVSVVGITVSKEQAIVAQDRCAGLPVTIRLQDYREVTGHFDAIVSIGMFEHVEPKNYGDYFSCVNRCLDPYGRFLLHTIGKETGGAHSDPFIRKYVFPQGMIPGMHGLRRSIGKSFCILDWHAFGSRHYEKTLIAWRTNFRKAWPELRERYGKKLEGRFARMWDYYLSSCAGAFRAGRLDLYQIVLAKHPQHYLPVR